MGAIAQDWGAIAMTHISRREPRVYVDFSSVPVSQWKMHDRLENWARSIRGGDKQSGKAAPMFVLYRSSDARREYGVETAVPVNRDDARKVGEAISAMTQDKERRALNWFYARGGRAPGLESVRLRVSMDGLKELVREGRQLLINARI